MFAVISVCNIFSIACHVAVTWSLVGSLVTSLAILIESNERTTKESVRTCRRAGRLPSDLGCQAWGGQHFVAKTDGGEYQILDVAFPSAKAYTNVTTANNMLWELKAG